MPKTAKPFRLSPQSINGLLKKAGISIGKAYGKTSWSGACVEIWHRQPNEYVRTRIENALAPLKDLGFTIDGHEFRLDYVYTIKPPVNKATTLE